MSAFVAYYRVSTARQGRSGLGLDAQREAVRQFVSARDGALLGVYTEVESGRHNDRAELAKALRHAALTNATLLIAKLDRLSRNAHFLLGLQEAGVDFLCCDMPQATPFTIGVMGLVAQQEAEMASQRTKAALAAARARGVRLGAKPGSAGHLRKYGNHAAVEAVMANARERAERMQAVVAHLRAEGLSSNEAVARELSARQFATARGGAWRGRDVAAIMERAR